MEGSIDSLNQVDCSALLNRSLVRAAPSISSIHIDKRAIGRQAADALLALEMARPVVYRAAYSLAHQAPAASQHVSAAKARASEAALLVGRKALQCHGAIAYSYEHDLHLWMKRCWGLAGAWGDSGVHLARVGAAIL